MSVGAHHRRGPLARAARRVATAIHPDVEVVPLPDGVLTELDVPVVVRDGTTLRVNVFRPAGGERVPAIVSAHPYGKDAVAGKGIPRQYRLFPQPRPIRLSAWTGWEAPDPGAWVPHGYAVVNVDLRGGGTSEGTAELFSDEEARDYADVIAWVGRQPWCTGKVGLDGVSYLAISQYKVAALRPPHLAAICPWEGFTDLYRDFARPGGVREDGFLVVWSVGTRRGARVRGDLRREVVDRPERDAWYEALAPRLEQIEVPILVCGSFSDASLHTRGSFEAFRRVGSRQKWLYTHRDGKWSAYYGEEATRTRRRFFDHFLKGVDDGWDREPPVRLAVHEGGPDPVAVTHEAAWPPPDLTWTTLHLDAASGRLLDDESPPATVAFDTRRGSARFTWTVPADLDVIGPMALRVRVEVEGADDVHLFVAVRKVVDGEEVPFEGSYGFDADVVSKGWQRAAHRELDPELSTPWQPVHTHRRAEPLAPGEVVPVHVALRPHATRFRAGERLVLEVQGRWLFPRDPLRGQFPAAYEASPPGRCVVHTGGGDGLRIGWRAVAAG